MTTTKKTIPIVGDLELEIEEQAMEIFGVPYSIDEVTSFGSSSTIAEHDAFNLKISIRESLPPMTRLWALCHEITEAINHLGDLELEHTKLQTIASGWMTVILKTNLKELAGLEGGSPSTRTHQKKS